MRNEQEHNAGVGGHPKRSPRESSRRMNITLLDVHARRYLTTPELSAEAFVAQLRSIIVGIVKNEQSFVSDADGICPQKISELEQFFSDLKDSVEKEKSEQMDVEAHAKNPKLRPVVNSEDEELIINDDETGAWKLKH